MEPPSGGTFSGSLGVTILNGGRGGRGHRGRLQGTPHGESKSRGHPLAGRDPPGIGAASKSAGVAPVSGSVTAVEGATRARGALPITPGERGHAGHVVRVPFLIVHPLGDVSRRIDDPERTHAPGIGPARSSLVESGHLAGGLERRPQRRAVRGARHAVEMTGLGVADPARGVRPAQRTLTGKAPLFCLTESFSLRAADALGIPVTRHHGRSDAGQIWVFEAVDAEGQAHRPPAADRDVPKASTPSDARLRARGAELLIAPVGDVRTMNPRHIDHPRVTTRGRLRVNPHPVGRRVALPRRRRST